MEWRTTMYAKGFWTIFQEKYVCQPSWKIVRNPFASRVVLQYMWKGPNHCWNFMESGSESATYNLDFLKLQFEACFTEQPNLNRWVNTLLNRLVIKFPQIAKL